MCGDHKDNTNLEPQGSGSPPHVRGPLPWQGLVIIDDGITPACAGTTGLFAVFLAFCRDHPRMCGDHVHLIKVHAKHAGSPPHVRGPLY